MAKLQTLVIPRNAARPWAALLFGLSARAALTATLALLVVPAVTAQAPGADVKAAAATQFVSLGERPAIVYDVPSAKGHKQWILARQQPLEVLVKLDKWVKVRDAEGTIGWIEAMTLGERRFVQVSASVADVRLTAALSAELAFNAHRAVLLEVTGPSTDGWLPVRHRDGQSGFVRKSQIWGD